MIKIFLIGIIICWSVAFIFPYVLKIVKHRKEKGVSDEEKSKDISKS